MKEELKKLVKILPQAPGVYKYFNAEGQIIYIGKAKNLKNRVSSYFTNNKQHNYKTKRLVKEIIRLEYIVVHSEVDALLLENSLIKNHKPKYNILLKDGKVYPYIVITNEPFPRVFITRDTTNKKDTYFGPFTSTNMINALMSLFKKLYPLRTCTYHLSPQNIQKRKFKVCLEYHIKNCKGPCEGHQDEPTYLEYIEQIRNILKGKLKPVRVYFKSRISTAVADLKFEEAELFKKRYEMLENYQRKSTVVSVSLGDIEVYTIRSVEKDVFINTMRVDKGKLIYSDTMYVQKVLDEEDSEILIRVIAQFRENTKSTVPKIVSNLEVELPFHDVEFVAPKAGDLHQLAQLSWQNLLHYQSEKEQLKLQLQNNKYKSHALLQLKADLSLKDLPTHIECFDNSNLQGTNPVAAMVCFKDGKPFKSGYRKYNIKTVEGIDDFASMYEAVHRRYKDVKAENMPHLIVIDGGKGQLSSACKALQDLDLYTKTSIVGIAKRLEEIFFPKDSYPVMINKKSRSLALLQRVRNEAHRFAIEFHRDKRSQNQHTSELDSIKGIGEKTKNKLFSHFRSISKIKSASQAELFELIGENKGQIVQNHFDQQTK